MTIPVFGLGLLILAYLLLQAFNLMLSEESLPTAQDADVTHAKIQSSILIEYKKLLEKLRQMPSIHTSQIQ